MKQLLSNSKLMVDSFFDIFNNEDIPLRQDFHCLLHKEPVLVSITSLILPHLHIFVDCVVRKTQEPSVEFADFLQRLAECLE